MGYRVGQEEKRSLFFLSVCWTPVLVSRENLNVPADAGFYAAAEAEKPR